MKCKVCTAEVPAAASFCPSCGAKLSLSDTAKEAPTAGPRVDAPSAAGGAVRRRPGVDIPEETLWEGSYSYKAMLGTLVLSGLVSLVLIFLALTLGNAGAIWLMVILGLLVVLWLVALGQLAARRLGIHYKLTNQMFYHQKGVLSRVTNRIEVIDIDDVTYAQGLFDRLVNVGQVRILSSDRTDPEFRLVGVDDVENVAQMIDKARRAERIRRGMSIESLSTNA